LTYGTIPDMTVIVVNAEDVREIAAQVAAQGAVLVDSAEVRLVATRDALVGDAARTLLSVFAGQVRASGQTLQGHAESARTAAATYELAETAIAQRATAAQAPGTGPSEGGGASAR
jgi:hypothetical protein